MMVQWHRGRTERTFWVQTESADLDLSLAWINNKKRFSGRADGEQSRCHASTGLYFSIQRWRSDVSLTFSFLFLSWDVLVSLIQIFGRHLWERGDKGKAAKGKWLIAKWVLVLGSLPYIFLHTGTKNSLLYHFSSSRLCWNHLIPLESQQSVETDTETHKRGRV